MNELDHPSTFHVKGHQKGLNLPWEAQLNNGCDQLANMARSFAEPCHFKLDHTSTNIVTQDIDAASSVPNAHCAMCALMTKLKNAWLTNVNYAINAINACTRQFIGLCTREHCGHSNTLTNAPCASSHMNGYLSTVTKDMQQ